MAAADEAQFENLSASAARIPSTPIIWTSDTRQKIIKFCAANSLSKHALDSSIIYRLAIRIEWDVEDVELYESLVARLVRFLKVHINQVKLTPALLEEKDDDGTWTVRWRTYTRSWTDECDLTTVAPPPTDSVAYLPSVSRPQISDQKLLASILSLKNEESAALPSSSTTGSKTTQRTQLLRTDGLPAPHFRDNPNHGMPLRSNRRPSASDLGSETSQPTGVITCYSDDDQMDFESTAPASTVAPGVASLHDLAELEYAVQQEFNRRDSIRFPAVMWSVATLVAPYRGGNEMDALAWMYNDCTAPDQVRRVFAAGLGVLDREQCSREEDKARYDTAVCRSKAHELDHESDSDTVAAAQHPEILAVALPRLATERARLAAESAEIDAVRGTLAAKRARLAAESASFEAEQTEFAMRSAEWPAQQQHTVTRAEEAKDGINIRQNVDIELNVEDDETWITVGTPKADSPEHIRTRHE